MIDGKDIIIDNQWQKQSPVPQPKSVPGARLTEALLVTPDIHPVTSWKGGETNTERIPTLIGALQPERA